MRSRPRLMMFALLGACQAPTAGSSSSGATPGITTAGLGSTGESAAADTTNSTSSGGSASAAESNSGESGESTLPVLDLGTVPDGGDGKPAGCKGKIDLLFVISRGGTMKERQARLIDAFPKFIATIESKFADFDYHIMIVDGDATWGLEHCTADCPGLACKVGEPCCSAGSCVNCPHPIHVGDPCCGDPDYPCQLLDLVTECDHAFGAGSVFPAGQFSANKPCPIDGDLRYLVKGQSNLADTFACLAQVGIAGGDRLGQALTAAMKKNINDPGGCNRGFLRKDALLMVTLIGGVDQGGGGLSSEGYPADWAKAVLDAKHGDAESVVMFYIGRKDPACEPYDGLCQLVQMFPYGLIEYLWVDDYGPAFAKAAGLVETVCAGFVPPG